MGIRLKFILLLVACFTIPSIAIITNLDDWLNNNQHLELFRERQKYHQLGELFDDLFQSYLTSIHLLSRDYAKDLNKLNRRKNSKGLNFSRVNSDPSYWTNGYSFDGRFFGREYKSWSSAQRANFLGKNIRIKSLLNNSVIKKLLPPSLKSDWEAQSPALVQVFALEKNLLKNKKHTAQNLRDADQDVLSNKFRSLRIQPLIHYGSESNQWIWDQLIGIIQNLYEFIAQPDRVSKTRMNELVKYFGNSLPNSRGQRFPIAIEGLEFEIAWNTVPSTFNLNDFINGDSSEEIPDCISVSIIFMQKARNRFLEAWVNSDLEKLFTRIDPTNRSNWKNEFRKFSLLLNKIENSCKVIFFDSIGVQTLDNVQPSTTDKKRINLESLKLRRLDYIYNQNGSFGIDIFDKNISNFSNTIASYLYDLAYNNSRGIDFRASQNTESVIGSMVTIQSLPSCAFLILKNDEFLFINRKNNIRDFALLIFFLAIVSFYFYSLLHKKLVLPVTKLSNTVLHIVPGTTISLRDDSLTLNQELESLHYEFDDLQNRMNLDYKAMQLSKKLLSTCTDTQAKVINLALATEISIFLDAKGVCLGLYQNGVSRRGSDYSVYANNDENLGKVLKRQMLHDIQLNTSIPVGVSLLDASDSYQNAYQIHVNLDSAIGIGALIRIFEPEDHQLIQTGKLEEVMFQIVPSLIKKEIDELQEEQKVGSELQKRFQTTDLDVPSFDYAQAYMPARGLAGDTILSWIDATQTYLYVSIGDTAGKGVGPSLYGATCVSLLRSMAEDKKYPNLILQSLNKTLCEYQSSHMFLTFFLARIDLKTFQVDFASAGHNQMLLCRNNGTFEELSAKGIPLGIMPEFDFESCQTHIDIGDRLFLYTDGVTEAEDLYMELYGKERLLAILSKYIDKNSEDTLDAIKTSLGQYTRGLESSDDITMISLRRES